MDNARIKAVLPGNIPLLLSPISWGISIRMPPIHSYTRLMQHENGPEAHLFPQTADMGMAKAGNRASHRCLASMPLGRPRHKERRHGTLFGTPTTCMCCF
jgi:hypothetical protein